ncbi:MAG: hypothetical protein VX733_06350 [Candidatus Latescibacterota bacterium]|nr:hypothetical protein [Candidatus Latescibacterota bacterium]
MDNATLLQELEGIAGQLAVEIRFEDLEESRSGLCWVGGDAYILVDRNLTLAERIKLMVRSVSRLPLESIFIRPDLRQLLEEGLVPSR